MWFIKYFSSFPTVLLHNKDFDLDEMSPGVLSLLRGSLSVYYVWLNKKKRDDFGGNQIGESGHRSRYLPHAKRALYHLS